MGMYQVFKTDSSLENNGIWVDYGDFKVLVSRAGGTNKRYERLLEQRVKPLKRAIETDLLSKERAEEVIKDVFAETIVLDWQTKDHNGDWHSGIEGEDGTLLPFNKENVLKTFKNLPDLFYDLQDQASKSSLFRQHILEAEGKN